MPVIRQMMLGVSAFAFVVLTALAEPGDVPATTRSEFLFQLQTALKTRDTPAIAACFEFERVEPLTRIQVTKAIARLVSWKAHDVRTSERSGSGPLRMKKEGQTYTLNGDWTFQVHVQNPATGGGFVFPAGRTKAGRYAILLSVPG